MSKIRSIVIILGVVLVMLPSVARAQATPTEIKLLTQETGWALIHGRLYWTDDFGQDWRDITPPLSPPDTTIAGAFFLGTSNGWTLLRTSHSAVEGVVFGDWGFELAHTANAGASWSVTPVQLPGLAKWQGLGGGGDVGFVDPLHGWMDLSLESNAGTARGALFSTDDGGETWERVPNAPMIAAAVRFVTPQDGWLAGGPAGQDLYATHDGGSTWARTRLRSPLKVGRRGFSSYGLPVFADTAHGSVIVSDPWGRWLTLFATRDGGRSWVPVASLSGLPLVGTVPAVAVDSELVAGWVAHRTSIALAEVGAGGRPTKRAAPVPAGPRWTGSVTALTFMDARTGWALAGGMVYSTTDGGSSWTDITPGRGDPVAPHAALGPKGGGETPAPAMAISSTTAVTAAASPDGIWGVVMETGYPNVVATLVAIADGSVSLYFSNGGGIIGLGAQEGLQRASRALLDAAPQFRNAFEGTAKYPLPREGHVRFYLLAQDAALTAEAKEEELAGGAHALSPLFRKAHELITEIRLVDEKRQAEAAENPDRP